jgi:hypothetical protein
MYIFVKFIKFNFKASGRECEMNMMNLTRLKALPFTEVLFITGYDCSKCLSDIIIKEVEHVLFLNIIKYLL